MQIMKKTVIRLMVLTLLACLLAGCGAEESPYVINDSQGYTVSVKYDANGGIFTTNTSVMVDTYNLSQVPQNGGVASIALLEPNNAARGNDAFSAVKNGYFLAGWYAGRTENGTDEKGNPRYIYSEPWDFAASRLEVDTGKTYTSAEPVLTLYAAWVPMLRIDFYDRATGEFLESHSFDPSAGMEFPLPQWDRDTGAIEMYDFPEYAGHTYDCAFYDAAGAQPVTGESVTHPGTVDYATGSAENGVLSLYLDWTEGQWYHIYSLEQFKDHASVAGSYVLHTDLDFTDEIWPSSLMYGNFSGTIEGNGHIIKNVQLRQTNNSKVNAGLFGYLTEEAAIRDVTFENITFTIEAGTRVAGTSYGLLAGTVSAEAEVTGVSILASRLLVDAGSYFGVDDYVIGLVCGMGSPVLDAWEITAEAVGENLVVTADDSGAVTLEFLNS